MGWYGKFLGNAVFLYLDCGDYTNVYICQMSPNILKKGICTLCKIQPEKKVTEKKWLVLGYTIPSALGKSKQKFTLEAVSKWKWDYNGKL